MASATFTAYDKTMRRTHLLIMLNREIEAENAKRFRASLVVNPRTGRPLRHVSTHGPAAMRDAGTHALTR